MTTAIVWPQKGKRVIASFEGLRFALLPVRSYFFPSTRVRSWTKQKTVLKAHHVASFGFYLEWTLSSVA